VKIGVSIVTHTRRMSVDILKKVERGELMQDPRHITDLRPN
jgi:hypothetical protein